MKIKLILLLLSCLTSFEASAANMFISPSYMYMPGNVYNTVMNSIMYSDDLYNCNMLGPVKKVLIKKSEKTLQLLDANGCIVKQYNNIRLGKNKGPKQCDGDKKTPEGIYKIIEKRHSKYHRFLAIDYPRQKDIKRAKELGCKPGDSIGIHSWIEGLPRDGSLGCITVWTKKEILEIEKLTSVGTVVEIIP